MVLLQYLKFWTMCSIIRFANIRSYAKSKNSKITILEKQLSREEKLWKVFSSFSEESLLDAFLRECFSTGFIARPERNWESSKDSSASREKKWKSKPRAPARGFSLQIIFFLYSSHFWIITSFELSAGRFKKSTKSFFTRLLKYSE